MKSKALIFIFVIFGFLIITGIGITYGHMKYIDGQKVGAEKVRFNRLLWAQIHYSEYPSDFLLGSEYLGAAIDLAINNQQSAKINISKRIFKNACDNILKKYCQTFKESRVFEVSVGRLQLNEQSGKPTVRVILHPDLKFEATEGEQGDVVMERLAREILKYLPEKMIGGIVQDTKYSE